MSNTTSENIKIIAPELSCFIESNLPTIELILEDVADQITSSVYGNKQEKAQRYLAAHHLTLIKQSDDGVMNPGAVGPVSEEKVGDVRVRYSESFLSGLSDSDRYDETKYGRVYSIIKKGCIIPFRVVTP